MPTASVNTHGACERSEFGLHSLIPAMSSGAGAPTVMDLWNSVHPAEAIERRVRLDSFMEPRLLLPLSAFITHQGGG